LGRAATGSIPPQLVPIIAVAIGGFMILVLVVMLVQGEPPLFVAIAALLMLFSFGGIAWRWAANHLARRMLGDVAITIDPEETMQNGQIRVTFKVCPERQCEVHGLYATLLAKEVAVSGSGTNKSTYSETLHRDRVAICSAKRTIAAGETLELSGMLTVPRDAAPSFQGGSNKVVWEVAVEVDIPRWPDLNESHDITVQPS